MIPLSFFLRSDVVEIAKELIGKKLFTCFDGELTGGIITETEAYAGILDQASHAYRGRRTRRNEAMYLKGGVAYVYLCYGIHHLLNIVTNKEGDPHAVLIRGIEPTTGIARMQQRRGGTKNIASGPGNVTQALGITLSANTLSLLGPQIFLTEGVSPKEIEIGPRIGVEYAQEDALLPYRFVLKGKNL